MIADVARACQSLPGRMCGNLSQAEGARRSRPVLLQLQSVSAKHGYVIFNKGLRFFTTTLPWSTGAAQ